MRLELSRMRGPVIALSLALFAASCSGPGAAPTRRAAVTDEANAFLDTWLDASDAGAFASIKPMYSGHPDFRWIEDGRIAYGSASDAAAALDMAANAGFVADMDLANRTITPLSDDAAMVSADYSLTFQFGPDTRIETGGVFTAVLVKEDGEWKFLQGHLSAPAPAAPGQEPPAPN